jgi:hypothetical protein
MKIALAVLAMAPVMLVAGCKEKPPAPPPPDPILGAWACAITTKTANAKIDATFAQGGTLTAKIALNASPGGKRLVAKLDATGTWSRMGLSFAQSLKELTVVSVTTNGEKSSDSAATSLVRGLKLEGKGLVVQKADATEFVYETTAGPVKCKR